MRIITFDIETYGNFGSGPRAYDNIEMTICCVHDSQTNTYDSFLKDDLPRLWKLFESTDVLVGYNSDHFDIPILNKYYPGDLSKIKSIDLLKDIHASLGRRIKLDAVAAGTLGSKKSADGRQAMVWWKEGNIKMLREYCLKDVEITKKIFDHMLKKSAVSFKELGLIKEIKIDTSKWLVADAPAALTKTLGF